MSVTTTRRTEATLAVDSEEVAPLCPMTRKSCLLRGCMLWDGDYDTCSMSPLSLYHQTRNAVTDAAVEIMKAYGDDRR